MPGEGRGLPGKDHIPWLVKEAMLGGGGVPHRPARPAPRRSGLWRRFCSATSSARPSWPHRWAICAGGSSSPSMTASAAARSSGSGAATSRGTGDGLLASFDGPARAITAAAKIGRALEPLDLPIRAGVHTGECERIGEDLGGIAVHIGAQGQLCCGARGDPRLPDRPRPGGGLGNRVRRPRGPGPERDPG